VRFSTDDGQFGFLVTSLTGHGMYRFQVIIEGRLVGDHEPCIIGSAMKQLENRPRLSDKRLDPLSAGPDAVMSTLRFDERLHDAATLSLAESLDRWLIHGYVYGSTVMILAQERQENVAVGRILVSMVNLIEYDSIVEAVRTYWLNTNN
jgi:hypothetical protein